MALHKNSCIFRGVTKRSKLLEKLMAGRSDKAFTFDEAEQVLLQSGFVHDGGKGSHHVYRHIDGRKMVLPHHGKGVLPAYIREIRKLLKP